MATLACSLIPPCTHSAPFTLLPNHHTPPSTPFLPPPANQQRAYTAVGAFSTIARTVARAVGVECAHRNAASLAPAALWKHRKGVFDAVCKVGTLMVSLSRHPRPSHSSTTRTPLQHLMITTTTLLTGMAEIRWQIRAHVWRAACDHRLRRPG
jgi:hypothetical protein